MPTTSTSDLQLPTSDEGLVPDLSQEVGKHLLSVKTRRHLRLKRAGGAAVDVLGGGKGRRNAEDEDEVDDSWFGVKEEDPSWGFVKLSAKVPQRAGTMLKRTIQSGRHFHRGRSGKKVPAIVVEEDADADRFELEEDKGGAAFGAEPTMSTFSEGPLHASPTGSTDSLLTIDLPFSSSSTTGPLFSSDSSHLHLPYGRSAPPFATLSSLPTLSELRSFDSTSSSSPSVSGNSPSGANTPTRTLSIDEGAPMHGVKRTTSRSTFRSGNHRHRLHLPGRPKFSMRRKKTLDIEEKVATPRTGGLSEAVAKGLLEAGVIKQQEEEKVEVDVLYEHQRGLVVFGIPRFSSAALLQVDPSEWCDASLRPSPFTPHDHPCPPYWLWRDSEFMVCMSGDVDEEGWSYAPRFRSHHWSGEPMFPYAFVRRRQWIRTRIYRPEPVLSPAAALVSASTSAAGSSKADVTAEFRDEMEQQEQGEEGEGEKANEEKVTDLRSACRCLPLYAERRAAIFAESSAGVGSNRCTLDPRNPFLSFQQLKREAAVTGRAEGGEEKELVWRDAVIEINYRRVVSVMKAHGRIDRKRLELWRRWFGETKKGVEGEKGKQREGEADAASVREGPEVEDVWDVVEARLDLILPLFDYNLTRLSFLRLILSLHPSRAASHRHEGYDLPCSVQRQELEKNLAGRTGVSFYSGVEELVREYECAEGMEEERERDKEREKLRREKQEEKRKLTVRRRKGKERA